MSGKNNYLVDLVRGMSGKNALSMAAGAVLGFTGLHPDTYINSDAGLMFGLHSLGTLGVMGYEFSQSDMQTADNHWHYARAGIMFGAATRAIVETANIVDYFL